METFSALLAICAGNSLVIGEFPAQGPVTRSFDVSFDLHLNKRLSKQSWGWWFETPLCPLWRHSNDIPKRMTSNLCARYRHMAFDCILKQTQCVPDISRSLFSKKLMKDTHSSPVRESYGCFLCIRSLAEMFTFEVVVLGAISCYIIPPYIESL